MEESQKMQGDEKDGAGNAEQYIDELAGDGDYWLSITDAGRITRRQEITIRRWVATGKLPVRRQRMGLNKRTRHVRASDLARLTPIIDTAAAISGATAQVDLVSIPVQQAQILATHIQLQQDLATLDAQIQQALAAFTIQLTEQATQQERFPRLLAETQQAHTVTLRTAQAQWLEELHSLHRELDEQIASLTDLETTREQAVAHQRQEILTQIVALADQLAAHEAATHTALAQNDLEWSQRLEKYRMATEAALIAHHSSFQQQIVALQRQLTQMEAQILEYDQRATKDREGEDQWLSDLALRLIAVESVLRRRRISRHRAPRFR